MGPRTNITKKQRSVVCTAIITAIIIAILTICGITYTQKTTSDQPKDERTDNTSVKNSHSTDSPQGNEHSQLSDEEQQNAQRYSITKIVDGDTIHVDMNGTIEKIRFIGINTPETKDPRKNVECFGIEASQKLNELLHDQKVILMEDKSQGNTDKYQRLLRYVYKGDGTNINKTMIEEGYAYEYTYDTSNPYKFQQEFQDAQQNAQNQKRGLWADNVCENSEKRLSEQIVTDEISILCTTNTYNCDDFDTQEEAQHVYDRCFDEMKNDIHKLDGNNNGRACE